MRRARAEKLSRMFAIIGMSWVSAAISPSFGGDHLIPVVTNGEARAIVVTAETPSPVATLAAEELVQHIQKATGVNLAVVAETDETPDGYTRIYVGETEAAREQGIDSNGLGHDTFVLRAEGNKIYILGKETDSCPFERVIWGTTRHPYNGTAYGVYEFLERFAGVRWLWPGELGTFTPHHDSIEVNRMDEVVAPALRFRRVRYPWLSRPLSNYDPRLKRLSFSQEALTRYNQDIQQYLYRSRVAYALPSPGHYFSNWWERYGEAHPEWFMETEAGHRATPEDDRRFQRHGVPMCVSNPDLHDYIVHEVWNGGGIIPLFEVDVAEYCRCAECMAWDGPQPEGARQRVTSERYARFAQTIYEMAAPRNPDVNVFTFLSFHYFQAPRSGIKLSPNILGWFCNWGGGNTMWYPESDERQAWKKAQWEGWAGTGLSMIYRPNHTLAGYAMPHVQMRQPGEFFRFAYRHGMVGADFDSLLGQWAVRGPEHYMYLRLLTYPEKTIEDILAEYYAAFGPAAEQVEQYFDYWEDHNNALFAKGNWADMWARPDRDNRGRHRGAPLQYPPDVFLLPREILEAAAAAVKDHPDPQFAERVEFLKAGLEHARLSVSFIRHLKQRNDSEAETAMHKLIAFRRKHEDRYIADYTRPAGLELRAFGEQIDELFRQGD